MGNTRSGKLTERVRFFRRYSAREICRIRETFERKESGHPIACSACTTSTVQSKRGRPKYDEARIGLSSRESQNANISNTLS
jgi:hypothetical protein